jgi:intein-encoded DNA endonuclease-like protein
MKIRRVLGGGGKGERGNSRVRYSCTRIRHSANARSIALARIISDTRLSVLKSSCREGLYRHHGSRLHRHLAVPQIKRLTLTTD